MFRAHCRQISGILFNYIRGYFETIPALKAMATSIEDIIERALAEDPEYLSKWRDDLSTWLCRELLDAAVDRGVAVRAPVQGINYIAGCDASGGRNDSFTAAISHRERDGKIVLDLLYERRSPFNPSEFVAEIVALMRQYRCTKIVGDKYGAQWKVVSDRGDEV